MTKKRQHNIERIIWLSLLIITAAQFSLSPLDSGFQISFAVICLAAAVYINEETEILPITVLTSFGVFLTRLALYTFRYDSIGDAAAAAAPEILFYIIYGAGLLCFAGLSEKPIIRSRYLLFTMLLDYSSNMAELLARSYSMNEIRDMQLVIIGTALMRTLILWGILVFLSRYRLVLLRKSNAQRYQRLMVLVSRLGGEVTWMQKNSSQIERVMEHSYMLYNKLEREGDERMASLALGVAKDIHEIKKEYLLIMRGLSEAIHNERTEEGMALSELLMILRQSVLDSLDPSKRKPRITVDCPDKLYSRDPYPLLSVIHNLVTNSLEAEGFFENAEPEIAISADACNEGWQIIVSDNGKGIPEENLNKLFIPGFSTKIDWETGLVARGLGLPIVRDIVEDKIGGSISVNTSDSGTTFTIKLPEETLEVME